MRINLRLAAIFALALFLRTINLSTIPYWDWDEGGNINYSLNLMDGQARYFAYYYHFIPHPPLYLLFLAAFFKAFGAGILSIRIFSVCCSLTGLLVTYWIVRLSAGEKTGLLSALIYAIFPELVFWGRMGFANNLLGLLVLSAMYFLLRFIQRGGERDLTFSCLLTGLCPLTEYAGVVFIPCLGVVLFWHDRERLGRAMALACAPFACFVAIMLAFDAEGFVRDAGRHMLSYPFAVPVLVGGVFIFRRYSHTLRASLESAYLGGDKRDPSSLVTFVAIAAVSIVPINENRIYLGSPPPSAIFLICLLGLFFIRDALSRGLFLTYTISYFLAIIALNRWDHMQIPILSLICCCGAFFIENVKDYLGKGFITVMVVLIPLSLTLQADLDAFANRGLCVMPTESARSVNGYLNQMTTEDDVVLTFSYLAQGMRATPTTVENVLQYYGQGFADRQRAYGKDEFAYNLSLSAISYAVAPSGMAKSFEASGHVNFGRELGNWTVVYEATSLQKRNPGAGSEILRFLGLPPDCASDFQVLKNPNRP
jgi:hypothetical protein